MATAAIRRYSADKKNEQLVAVAVDKDKGSQNALKWTVEHLVSKGETVILLHVKQKSLGPGGGAPNSNSDPGDGGGKIQPLDAQTKELLLPFRCFCSRKEIKTIEAVVEETDIAKGITNYCVANAVEALVLGTPYRGGFVKRFKTTDVPTTVMKGIPDYCNVYVISKGKISTIRNATAPAPSRPSIIARSSDSDQIEVPALPKNKSRRGYTEIADYSPPRTSSARSSRAPSIADTDISFVSVSSSAAAAAAGGGYGRMSADRIIFPSYDNSEFGDMRLSNCDTMSVASSYSGGGGTTPLEFLGGYSDFSSTSDIDSARLSSASQGFEDPESEVRRLRLELKQTMEMYNNACKEALTAKSKAKELQRWKMEKQQRVDMSQTAEEVALAAAEEEKAKRRAAMEAAKYAKLIAEKEARRRRSMTTTSSTTESEEWKQNDNLTSKELRCRQYTIDEIKQATNDFSPSLKIGEGGYGPVYRCNLDHTPVAIKSLRPDAAQGRAQFQQEVDVLSRIRHPNMVLLMGACPDQGCLVYEYMANGSLDDRLSRRGNTPPLSWQLRFRIAAEIATGLHFLHQTKPEPLVHRDLKPGNILLDRNYVSKISDVGLARLVPPSVADSITQYRMTQTAGTFCYIDPEYQQTGMLGTKSDIYSLGIILLQLLTAKPPMGLTHHVSRAIKKGEFPGVLDPDVPDWPVEDALRMAKLAIRCAELRKKDRPDLSEVVLPELCRLRDVAEEKMASLYFAGGGGWSQFRSGVQPENKEDVELLTTAIAKTGYTGKVIPVSDLGHLIGFYNE
ncbi:U-box domain-containing protein 52 [Linum grandiflorum]